MFTYSDDIRKQDPFVPILRSRLVLKFKGRIMEIEKSGKLFRGVLISPLGESNA